jgi:HlyD family secretion protein
VIRDTSDQDITIMPNGGRKIIRPWMCVLIVVIIASVTYTYPRVEKWQGTSLSVAAEKLRFGKVKRADLVRDVSVQGRVVAAIKPMMFSPASGRVSLLVRAGDAVKKGQAVAKIDSPDLTSQLKQEISTLASFRSEVEREALETRSSRLALKQKLDLSKVTLTAAKREMRRAQIAFDKNVISLQDHEKAIDDLHRAELEYENQTQENQLGSEKLDLELKIRNFGLSRQQLSVDDLTRKVSELSIMSPVTGVVGNLEVNEKDAVGQYQPLMTVVDLSAYEVEVDVPEGFANDLSLGIDVAIELGGVNSLGSLASISPEIANGQVKCRVRFLEAKQAGLRQNQRVSARILLETKSDVLLVSRGNFLQIGGGKIAYVLEDDIASKRSIQTGVSSVGQIEILGGLEAGETIVLSGAAFFEGQDQILIIE